MPNSVIQGLTTATAAGLNALPAFETTVLLGLFALVDEERPDREVRVRPGRLLDIVAVGKTVAQAVERTWQTSAGGARRRRYRADRYHPQQIRQVHDSLQALHQRTVVVRCRTAGRAGYEDRHVHLLDSFGYEYRAGGRPLDVDDLPAGLVKVNAAGPDERPVWKVARRSPAGPQPPRPAAVLFRLNRELAAELAGARGTVHYTVVARELFALLRQFSRQPVGIRLTLLVLRQTELRFVRRLGALLTGLGGDGEHRRREVARLGELLGRLQVAGVVTGYQIDEGEDRLTVDHAVGWPAAG